MATPDYAQLVAKAEAAVASVKDPELKRVAFQKILDDLLGARHDGEPTVRATKVQPTRSATKAAGAKKAATRRGPQGYVDEMVQEGFFRKPKTIAQVKAELENRGHHIALTSLSGPLQKLCQRRMLRRQKTNSPGGKQTYAYSDW
jgi:hypothetical protein